MDSEVSVISFRSSECEGEKGSGKAEPFRDSFGPRGWIGRQSSRVGLGWVGGLAGSRVAEALFMTNPKMAAGLSTKAERFR